MMSYVRVSCDNRCELISQDLVCRIPEKCNQSDTCVFAVIVSCLRVKMEVLTSARVVLCVSCF